MGHRLRTCFLQQILLRLTPVVADLGLLLALPSPAVAKVFVHNLKMNCLMLSYRGYGLSEGTPNEKGIKVRPHFSNLDARLDADEHSPPLRPFFKSDAQTALDFITNHPVLGKGPILLFGQSIGGAVAINLAANNPSVPAALILENTFTSISDLIPALAPPLASFTWLLREKWDSRTQFLALPADLPILLLSGRKDEIVPSKHMDELAKIANMRDHGNGKQKTVLKKFLEGNHSACRIPFSLSVGPGGLTVSPSFPLQTRPSPRKATSRR